MKKSLFSALYTLFAFTLCAQQDDYALHIRKAQAPMILDGKLEEADWQTAAIATNFKLNFPNDTAFSSWQTEARVTFDDEFLYVGAVCFEQRADYTVQSLKRDFGGGTSDVINITLDPTKDGLNGFIFSVSPLNVQREGLISNGENLELIWDNKWYSKVTNFDGYWVAEMAIPFKTLRYKVNAGENTWRINFVRTKMKDFEVSTWKPAPRYVHPANLGFAGDLVWDQPPPKPKANISLIPYGTGAYAIDHPRNESTLGQEEKTTNWTHNVGLDAKIGITPSLNLDLTVNPDFSQVEVDRQVANLSRFELFFPETRQFFLENSDLFAFFGFPEARPFFSRRIGLAYDPVLRANVKVPIQAGARISGKLNDNWRVGLLNMQTRRLVFDADNALPSANFTAASVQRRVFERSAISAIFVNKENLLSSVNEAQRDGHDAYNRVAGLEYNLYSKDNRWEGEWYYHRSFSPDKDKRGQSFASFLGFNDRPFSARFGMNHIGATYSADAGFVPRRGVTSGFIGGEKFFYPKKGWGGRKLSLWGVGFEYNTVLDVDLNQTDQSASVFGFLTFNDQAELSFTASNTYTYLFDAFDPTNLLRSPNELVTPLPEGSEYYYANAGLEYRTGTSGNWQGSLGLSAGEYFNGNSWTAEGEIAYRWQPIGLFSILFSYNDIQLPEPYPSADFYLLGGKADFSFTRSVFFSTFVQYNTQNNNFNVNARFQWRFAPVSDVFLVYTSNTFAQAIPNAPVEAFAPKNQALVFKVVYWLNL
jgi:hypothetical protein